MYVNSSLYWFDVSSAPCFSGLPSEEKLELASAHKQQSPSPNPLKFRRQNVWESKILKAKCRGIYNEKKGTIGRVASGLM